MARSLASRRSYFLATLVPVHTKGYWEAPVAGIQKAWSEIADYNVKLKNFVFDQFEASSFWEKANEMLSYKPDGVIITPVFKEETIKITAALNEQKIPYVFIDSNVEGLNNLSYFGQNSFQSGYLAARLLEMGLAEKSSIAIIKPIGSKVSNQGLNREKGFWAYFENEGLKCKYNFFSVKHDMENELIRENQLRLFFEEYSPISAAVVFNSRVYEIAKFIERYKIKNIRLIGYDLLNENADYLRRGIVSFLIAQRPEEQGYHAILTLFNHLAYEHEVPKVQYAPIDILTKDNIDFYINFNK